MRLPLRSLEALAIAALGASFAAAQEIKPTRPMVETPPETVTRVEETPVSTESAPQPVGFESEVYCYGYLSSRPERFPARVVGAENLAEQVDFVAGDLLFTSGGVEQGFSAGDEFFLVTPEREIVHPVTGKSLGTYYQYRGRGKIENLQGRSSVLKVTGSCTDIPIGSYLKPFEPIPIPLARKTPPAAIGDPPSGKASGHIVHSHDGSEALGADHTVFVNLGAGEGVEPGDFLTVFRYVRGRPEGREIGAIGANWVKTKKVPIPGTEIPRTYLGEIAILTVGDHWAVGRITDSYRLIEVGDEVELK